MAASTNQLVTKLKGAILPTAVASTVALGAVMMFNGNGVHASAVTAAPLDDHSVAAITSMDNAMSTLAARVTPAVVNIAVTSKGGEHEASAQDGDDQQGGGMQGLPPELRRFFGQGGMGGGQFRMQPQQPQIEHGIGSGVIISPDGYIATNDARGRRRDRGPGDAA